MTDAEKNGRDVILAKLEEKFNQLIDVVNDIKDNIKEQTQMIGAMDKEIVSLKIDREQQRRDIQELKEVQADNKRWIRGILATVVGGIALAVAKGYLGL